MSQFSKRPSLRPISSAKRHSLGVERHVSDMIFGGPGSSHELDFSHVGGRKPRRSVLTPLKRAYHYLAGKKRSIF